MSLFKILIYLLTFLFNLAVCRVYEIYTQDHLHDIFQDLKVGNRPATVIAFYNDGDCKETLKSMNFGQSAQIPSVRHVILAQYEMTHSKERVWYVFQKNAPFQIQTI